MDGPAGRLRAERARLVSSQSLRGVDFGAALRNLLDEVLADVCAEVSVRGRWALVALGSYARGELCPGSDVDLMLLVDKVRGAEKAAESIWYPLWDAGLVLGHSVRTPKDALTVADTDRDALTALLDVRVVAGDASFATELASRARARANKRRDRLIETLAATSAERRDRPGPVAEMLEPDLKQGAGGLRDLHALAWAGWVLVPGAEGGLDALIELGYLTPTDVARLERARRMLLDVRVELHRATSSPRDVLALQDQDAVAAGLGEPDADAMVRGLASVARDVAWIAVDAWSRMRSTPRGGRIAGAAPGVIIRDGRVAIEGDVDAGLVLRAALVAAERNLSFERESLERIGTLDRVVWNDETRGTFVDLLTAGVRAVSVFEALDYVGALEVLLPEWAGVRSLPQRNAYHRFTVDRHLLEAVAECSAILTADDFDGDVARRARRDLLMLGMLLHDIAKGRSEDHSVLGAEVAVAVGSRMGLDAGAIDTLAWLVRNHLLAADTATRRDLSDEATIVRFGRAVGTVERLELLYALTVADSRATGPSAWSTSKAALVRELFSRTDSLMERGVVDRAIEAERRSALAERIGSDDATALLEAMPAAYASAFDAGAMARHHELLSAGELACEWAEGDDGLVRCTVVAPDRSGVLAVATAALTLAGLDVADAVGFSHRDGFAVEVFAGRDRFGRLADEGGRAGVLARITDALEGRGDLRAELRERRRRYRVAPGDVRVLVDLEASAASTVIEVHAPDEVGLLSTVASVFADLALDVRVCKVSTLGDRVVDVFYLRDAQGAKITDRTKLDDVRATLVARLTSEYPLA